MRSFLLLTVLFTQACAFREGATFENGQLASRYRDLTIGVDLEGAETTATGMKIAKQDQSKVANQFVKTGGQAIAGYIGADVIKSVTNSNNAVTTAESANALKATQAKEATKIAKDANATSVKLFEAEAKAAEALPTPINP